MAKIIVRNLNFHYKDKHALKNLNLEIRANEILGALGPANSGITTLLRALNRLSDLNSESRVEGEIIMDGKNILEPDVNLTELRRRVGMVFDIPTPLPMSVFDNVAYGPRASGVKNKKALADTVERALGEAAIWDEIKDRLNVPAGSLSGGQQQRVCMARVLALDPEVILLDRPCSGLDPISTAKIEDSLTKLKEKFTIVLAPHNVQQAGRVCDRIAFFFMGELIEEGANADIFSNPKDKRTNDYITGRFG
ncbi:MAG: phosphate ABC transporter ATP-binding protein [Oscillospiraceae bacterium]|nr:phosphate ABC transporter ATP-binding protein [Oscillospiraceae bacterium]